MIGEGQGKQNWPTVRIGHDGRSSAETSWVGDSRELGARQADW